MNKLLIYTSLFFVLSHYVYGLPRKTGKYLEGRTKIIGGSDASYGEFPYQVSLQDGSYGFYYHICGAAIINENYVLTSAQCVYVYGEDIDDPYFLAVYAGDYTLDVTDGEEQVITLSSVIIHEDFNAYALSNDIAILQLSESLDLSGSYASAIALPDQGYSTDGSCTFTGWGDTSANGDPPSVLQKVSLSIISDDDCRDIYGDPDVEDSMVCAGGEADVGACNGDRGGPLACEDSDGSTYLGGIASWSYGCALDGYPAVFAEVAYFVDWINENTD